VESLAELEEWDEKLGWMRLGHVGFREPDLDGQLTAVACLSDGKPFRKLPLF